jgi:hypothetical protein
MLQLLVLRAGIGSVQVALEGAFTAAATDGDQVAASSGAAPLPASVPALGPIVASSSRGPGPATLLGGMACESTASWLEFYPCQPTCADAAAPALSQQALHCAHAGIRALVIEGLWSQTACPHWSK